MGYGGTILIPPSILSLTLDGGVTHFVNYLHNYPRGIETISKIPPNPDLNSVRQECGAEVPAIKP